MPVIFRSDGLTFFFYSNEGNPREPVHVHVRKAGKEAKIWLDPAIGIAESRGFNSGELSVILGMTVKNRDLIRRTWHEYFGH